MLEEKLCSCCRTVISTNDKLHHDHHVSAQDLFASAAGGCPLCAILCDCFHHSKFQKKVVDGEIVKLNFVIGDTFLTGTTAAAIRFTVCFPHHPRGKKALPLQHFLQHILVIPVDDGEASHARHSIASNTNTGSEEAWKVAMHWLDQCDRTHSKCHRTAQRSWRPTRLIDVGTPDRPCLHLAVTDNNFPVLPCTYTTLSHCWGEIMIKRLTKDELASMIKGFHGADLPKTFQDAIAITRRLGVRFLWIDSLCIIQDSEEDWAKESSMMGNVYQNGICNIAATGAADGSAGCFMKRDPILAQNCRIKIDATLSKVRLKPGIYDLVPEKLWEDGLSTAPLNQRAWVVQERILAPRVLHFSGNQLFWECNELDACEIYPDGLPDVLSQADVKNSALGLREYGFKKLRFKNLDPAEVRAEVQAVTSPWNIALIGPPPSGPLVDHYYVWNKVLLAYTRCSLTHDEDKLIAISAIAKQIQLLAKDTYLAGLWRRYLPYHLLWATDQRDKHRIRSPKYCAPSWSWASMKGRIEPYLSIRPDSPVMIQVLEARVQTTTSDLMGQVCDGCLKIQGWLRTFSIIYDREDSVFRINTKHSGLGLLPESFAQFDENQQPDDHEWWFLPILPLGPWIQSMAMGLIMVETGNRDEYRRVGMFMAYDDSARAFRRPTYPIQPTQSNVTEAMETREHPNGVQRNIIVKVNSTGSKSQHSKGGDTAKVAPNHESPSIASQENRNSPQGSENFHSSHTGKSTALGEDKKLWSFLKRRKKDNKDSWQERVITIV